MTTKKIPPDIEVLAAIGAWALHEAKGRPDMAGAIFNDVLPKFNNRYPHHKLLSHWCRDAKEAIDVTPGAENRPQNEEGMSVAELIQRLKLFRPDARVVVKAKERGFADIVEVRRQPIAAHAGLRPNSIADVSGIHLEPTENHPETEVAIWITGQD